MKTPDFQDLFNKYALRPILTNAKEKLDQTVDAIPASTIAQSVADAYAKMTTVDTGSSLNKMLDPDKVANAVNNLKVQLQNPEASLQLAQGLKQLLNGTSSEKFEAVIMKATQNASPEQQFAAQILVAQLSPKIDELKGATVNEVAEQIRSFGNNLSATDVNLQLDMLKKMASQSIAQQQTPVSQLPAPEAVADAFKRLGKAASDTLGDASNSATLAETVSILKQFRKHAADIVAGTLGQDVPKPPQTPVVKAPRKGKGKGKGFKV